MKLLLGAIIAVLAFFLGAVFRPYFTGYSKKKGENLATHEDIEKLVVQVRAVTEATKAIEARISNEVWNRQRHWEMKRDILIEAIRELAAMDDALLSLNNAYMAAKQSAEKNESDVGQWTARKAEALDKWSPASTRFDTAQTLASIVCGREVSDAFSATSFLMRKMVHQVFAGNVDNYLKQAPELIASIKRVQDSIRKDLLADVQPTLDMKVNGAGGQS